MHNFIEKFNNSSDINFINNFRINYYLGNVKKEIIVSRKNHLLFDDTLLLNKENQSSEEMEKNLKKYYNKYVRANKYFNQKYTNILCYYRDLYNYLNNYKKETNNNNIEYIFLFGDSTKYKDIPCLIKAKTINSNDYSVLLNLNSDRHMGMLNTIKNIDIPFNDKKNIVLWRGTDTSYHNNDERNKIILKYQNSENKNFDINFTKIIHNRDLTKYKIAEKMSICDMLQYKFLLSLEGNDVATNLKWILLSNSVVLMPKPTKCSWFMEDMLIPFRHYVPLNEDCSNLEEMYVWCMNNLDKCKKISQNATNYIKKFLNEENEKYITNEVLKGYFKNVKFVD